MAQVDSNRRYLVFSEAISTVHPGDCYRPFLSVRRKHRRVHRGEERGYPRTLYSGHNPLAAPVASRRSTAWESIVSLAIPHCWDQHIVTGAFAPTSIAFRSRIGYPTICPGPWYVTCPPRFVMKNSAPTFCTLRSSGCNVSGFGELSLRPVVYVGVCSA